MVVVVVVARGRKTDWRHDLTRDERAARAPGFWVHRAGLQVDCTVVL